MPSHRAAAGVFPSRAPAARQAREPVRILVVDNDPLTLRFVRDALAEAGYASHLMGDPQEIAGLVKTRRWLARRAGPAARRSRMDDFLKRSPR